MAYKYNYKMANKGRSFEELLEYQNNLYFNRGISTVQKISTPWVVIRRYGQIVYAHPDKKSTVDYRGAIRLCNGATYPVSFDAKETEEPTGLPLRNIEEHQIDFLESAIRVGEITFILVHLKAINKYCFINGQAIVSKYRLWQQNKGKKGYNLFPLSDMSELPKTPGNVCDYIGAINRLVSVTS